MPSLIAEEMRRSYLAQRGVSQGAGITLVLHSQEWRATHDCAKRCEMILGERWSYDYGPAGAVVIIPNEEMSRALAKLAENFSIALVDTVTDDQGTRFVLIWKIPAVVRNEVGGGFETALTPDPNQGLLPISSDLDDY